LGDHNSRAFEERWKEVRRALSLAIKVAKEKYWSNMIRTIDGDVWEKLYKIVMKRQVSKCSQCTVPYETT